MKNVGAIGVVVSAFFVFSGTVCRAAEVAGKIADRSGAPVPGAAISVKNQAGTQIGSGVSDTGGRYAIHSLDAGIYTFVVNGQTAVAYVGTDGLTVDWGLARDAPAIAVARRGIEQGDKNSSGPSSRPTVK
jgi:carboxypeptidase family protein